MFWLVLDPCFEWAGSARAVGRGAGGGAGRGAADASQEAAPGDRGAAPPRPGAQPHHRPAHARVGRRGVAAGSWIVTG